MDVITSAPDPAIDEQSAGRAQLLTLFDAASAVRADLQLWEREEPGAPQALRAWAVRHGRSVVEREVLEGLPVLTVLTGSEHHIDVHLLPR